MYFVKKVTLVTVFIFTGLSAVFAQMTTKDGKPLRYYGTSSPASTAGGLLKTGDGDCIAWTKLFLDTLKVHGIDTKKSHIKIGYFRGEFGVGILMRDWEFIGSGKSGIPEYPYVNVFKPGSTAEDIKKFRNLAYSEVRPNALVKGQGGTTPPNHFGHHEFVIMNGKYYDPSYGTESTDDRDFMLSGYMVMAQMDLDEAVFDVDFNGNGVKTDTVKMPVVLYKKHQKNTTYYEVFDY